MDIESIERLAKLKEEGHLTEDEYQQQKARLLNTKSEASPNGIGMAYGQSLQVGQYAQPPRTSQYAQMPNWQVQKVYPGGFFFLGLVVCIPLNMLSRMVDSGDDIGGLDIFFIALFIVQIVYAAAFYPSFFSNTPKIKSPKLISFLNGIFGWVIFGACWQSNLKKNKKGISHIVFIVMSIALEVLAGLLPIIQYTTYNALYSN
jgi:hypothetical protein